jgi:hypothetical protein
MGPFELIHELLPFDRGGNCSHKLFSDIIHFILIINIIILL